jgi:hypothetical protein
MIAISDEPPHWFDSRRTSRFECQQVVQELNESQNDPKNPHKIRSMEVPPIFR